MTPPVRHKLIRWSFYYFDEDIIDAIDNNNRHGRTKAEAVEYAVGEWSERLSCVSSWLC